MNLRALNAAITNFINFIESQYVKKRIMKKNIFHDCVIDGMLNFAKISLALKSQLYQIKIRETKTSRAKKM